MSITHRVGKTRNLTAAEVDANFDNLQTQIIAYQVTNTPANNLVTTDPAQPLAASQGPALTTLLGTKQATLVSGTHVKTINSQSIVGPGALSISGSDAVGVTHTNAIPLDLAGLGKYSNAIVSLAANRTLSLGASPIQDGAYVVTFQQDATGSRTITVPGTWIQRGTDAIGTAAGSRAKYLFLYSDTDVVYVIQPLNTADLIAATYGAKSIENSAADTIQVVMSETIGSTIPLTSDVTVTGAGGRTVIGVTAVGANLLVQMSSAMTYDVAASIAIAANKISDLSGNLSLALSSSPVTNNLTIPVPGAPTSLSLGATTSTTQVLTSWAAPSFDSTHGPALTYQPQYRTPAGSGGYTNFGSPVAGFGPVTITGLSGGTEYGIRLVAVNAAGSGGATAEQTITTSAGRITFSDPGTDNPMNARWTSAPSGWVGTGAGYAMTGGSYATIYATVTAGVNDFSVTLNAAAGFQYLRIAIRYVDANNYVAVLKDPSDSEKWHFEKCVAGSITAISTVPGVASTIGAGGTIRIVEEASNVLKFYQGASLIITITDSTHAGATKIALMLNTGHPTELYTNLINA